MSDWNTFINARNTASESIRQFIDDNGVGKFVADNEVTSEHKSEVINAITDGVLQIINYKETVDLLFDILRHETKASLLIQKLDKLYAELNLPKNTTTTEQTVAIETDSKNVRTEEIPATPIAVNAKIPSDDAKPTVAPLRTLEGDMKKVHGYGALPENQNQAASSSEQTESDTEPVHSSNQDEALKRPPLAETPKYNE